MTNILTRHPNLHISHPCPLNQPTGGIFCGSCLFCEWGGLRLGVCQLNPYWGAHNSVYCAKLLFAGFALYLKPVTPLEGNPSPPSDAREMHTISLPPNLCRQGFRNSGNPDQRCWDRIQPVRPPQYGYEAWVLVAQSAPSTNPNIASSNVPPKNS